ncbi:biotin--[acetyl-CoA-carboxylase] ligase [Ursidibacter sp. B-7004-1]
MIRLNQAEIQQGLFCGQALVFDEIDSTNEFLLKQLHTLPSGSICLAESQTAGRGRRGRQWYSPLGQNLYFSMLWHYPQQNDNLSSLSLVVALVIAETFQQIGIEQIQIKWPNDIYYQGKKMGGILIESKIDRSGVHLVIGIGLNLAMNTIDPSIVTQAWADLSTYHLDRNQLATQLAYSLQKTLNEYPQHSFSDYLARWHQFDCFYQKNVKLITPTQEIIGISQGVNEKGELLLQQGDKTQPFAIGEISLRFNS